MAQHFPEERTVQIKTSDLQENHLRHLLIIWSHHVLGQTVALCHKDGGIIRKFGEGHENVIIVACENLYNAEIRLLDGRLQDLFCISESVDDPEISADMRVEAKGFATQLLTRDENISQ